MLNKDLKLNPKVFNDDCEQVPIRKGFGQGLVIAGEANKNVVALCADLTESTQMHLFKEKFGDRYSEIGVAEQNLVTVASGMAAMGKIPFVSSYAMFSPGRNWEQIRTTIAYNDRPVIIVGSHAGVSVGPDGGTHQAVEDLALMRVMPNMAVISPCDAIEAKKATIALAKSGKPAYLRLAREKTPIITTEDTPFEIGKAQIIYKPEGLSVVGILATGGVVRNALMAAKMLEKQNIKATVVNVSSIKPFDTETILKVAKETKRIVTVEEHQIIGGLGGAVAEYLSSVYPIQVARLGVDDKFGQSGTPNELLKHFGLDADGIFSSVKKLFT